MLLLKNILKQILFEWVGNYENYWLNKEGQGFRVNNHESYACHITNKSHEKRDEAYEIMYHHGWARIIIQYDEMFVQTQTAPSSRVKLTREQKTWLEEKIQYYPKGKDGTPLKLLNIYGRNIEL